MDSGFWIQHGIALLSVFYTIHSILLQIWKSHGSNSAFKIGFQYKKLEKIFRLIKKTQTLSLPKIEFSILQFNRKFKIDLQSLLKGRSAES